MAMSFIAAGAPAVGAGGLTVAIPAHAVNDVIILIGAVKPDTGSVTTPASWTAITNGEAAGGGGTTGIDTGPTRIKAMYLVDASGSLASVALSFVGNNVDWGGALVFRSATGAYDIAASTGIDTVGDATYGAAMAADPGLAANDVVAWAGSIPTDVTTPAQFSSPTLTGTGLTASLTEDAEPDTSAGNDMGGVYGHGSVSATLTSGVPTLSMTATGTLTNVIGPLVVVRIREQAGAAVASLIWQPAPSSLYKR
jgi:hypothetical protein